MFNYNQDELFGRYCFIEQKRYGVPNEKFLYKIIGTFQSNAWSEVPVDVNDRDMKLHNHSEKVVNVICCGVCEEKVERYRLCDVYVLSNQEDNKWQKLKEWLNDRMEHYNDCLNENVLMSSERKEVLCARYNQCFETIAQMEYIEKELEGEDE